MRRYWIPALLAWELPEPDCPPVRVKLLGEELVAFRDTAGRIGLIAEHCPHRRVSLFFGRNEDCGLRCVYHGWKFDVDGRCVDMMNEPEELSFAHKIRTTAYPTVEAGGVSGPTWARRSSGRPCPTSRGRRSRRRIGTSRRSSRSATGSRGSRAASTPPTSRSCTAC